MKAHVLAVISLSVGVALAPLGAAERAQSGEARRVERIYVEPLPARPESEQLRRALIAQLRKVHTIAIAEHPEAADARLRAEGEAWIKGYRSLNPRSGRLPSNGTPIYGGFLSVSLIDAAGDTLWSYLASENAADDLFARIAARVAEHLADAIQSQEAMGVTAAAHAPVALNGAGATFPAPIYSRWFAAYRRHDSGVTIAYESSGSEAGVRKLLAGDVDFAGCDNPAILKEVAGNRADAYLLIPSVVGAVVPIVNLPGLTGDLALTPEALAGIFLGSITRWNDPLLAQANRGVRMPDLAITVVHRGEGSGTTYTWTDYLSRVSSDWRARVGAASSPAWPVGRAATGNEGVAQLVAQIGGSIGYVEFIYAVHSHVAYARVRNRHGTFLAASLESIAAAAAGSPALDDDLAASMADSSAAGAYPIVSFSWLVVPAHVPDDNTRTALAGFLSWMLAAGQREAAALGYLALPDAVAARARAVIAQIR